MQCYKLFAMFFFFWHGTETRISKGIRKFQTITSPSLHSQTLHASVNTHEMY